MATYTNTPDPRNDIVEAIAILINIALFMWILSWFTSCTPRTITVPEYHTQYVTRTDTLCKVDSVYKYDSVAVYLQGETICKDKYVYLDKYRYLYKTTTDTLLKTDSVRVSVPVERELSRWEQAKMDIGGWCIGATVMAFVGFALYLLYKHKKLWIK